MNTTYKNFFHHTWVKIVAVFVSLTVFLSLCYLLKGVLISLLLAFTVAYIFDPLVDFIACRRVFLSSKRVPRTVAIVILIAVVTLIGGGILTYAIPKTISGGQQVVTALKAKYPDYQKRVEELIEKHGQTAITALIKPQPEVEKERTQMEKPPALRKKVLEAFPGLKKYIPLVTSFIFSSIKRIFYSTFGFIGIITNFLIFGVVSVYLLKDFDPIVLRIKELLPSSSRDKVVEIFSKIDNNLRGFFRGQIVVCLILSLIYSIGLTIAGIPLAFFVGFTGGIGNIVPYVGTITGVALAVLLSLVQYHDLHHLIYILIVFAVGQLIEGTFLTPKIVGEKLGLSPVVVIISIIIWSQLLGFLGLLLAVPITSVAKVFIDEFIARYKASPLYSGKGRGDSGE